MKRILITGASGFIGSFLVEEAYKNKYKVFAGVRKTSNLKYLLKNNVNLFEVDLADKQAIKNKLIETGKFDYIIHNAGVTKTCKKNEFDNVNLKNTQNLIEALIETSSVPEKFIFISSLAAYGPSQNGLKPIKLTDKPSPVSLYGVSKLKTEKYLKTLQNFPYIIFRPTGVYGPREQDYLVMYKTIKSGLETYIGSSEQYLSFIYVKDLVHLIIHSLQTNIVNKSYFVSDLNEYTAIEFNNFVKQELQKRTIKIVVPKILVKIIAFTGEKISCFFLNKVPTLNTEKYKEISQKNWLCDSSDLIEDFNFSPKYDLKKGVHEAIKWYKSKKIL